MRTSNLANLAQMEAHFKDMMRVVEGRVSRGPDLGKLMSGVAHSKFFRSEAQPQRDSRPLVTKAARSTTTT